MSILITGAAGFIGFHLSQLLLEKGYEVFGIDSINGYYSTRIKQDRLNILQRYHSFFFSTINICNRSDVEALFASNKFSLVIHLAAQAGVRYSIDAPHKYAESNLVGFMNILEATRQSNVKKFVYASSSSVYGNRAEEPFTEMSETNCPESLYAATKKANELFAYSYMKQFNMQTIGLRFFSVYGPWGRPDMAYFSFTKNIISGKTIPVFNRGEMTRDFTYIDDITAGIYNLIQKMDQLPKYKIYNLGNSHPIKIKRFITALETAIGQKAKINFLPMQTGDVAFTCADINSATKDFHYQPKIQIDEGLDKFVKWYKNYYL